ncbi:rhamnosyltransferase WsaF family glycosyltransferase [Thiocystis violacea]|uniref:rhamnosyltransferase WsaF family glycosyltransferase n=1 Tax=Thiocystis violacea TaxID=13725 RepID=UPI0019037676|nr:glycosyltransferase [Thiocystis violacea]MBK1724123.1 glycosyl transferase family 1 [Thiocystis violacea]
MATLAWLIPRLVAGSGGIRTMFQQAKALEEAGHPCHLYIEGVGSDEAACRSIQRLFGYAFARARYGWGAIAPADAVIATIWYSAAIVRDLPFDCRRLYFVQDYEAWFSAMGDTYLRAEASYLTGLTPVTIGRWLKHRLRSQFGLPAYHFDFGADLAIYRPLPDEPRELAVCFLYQPEKPRRCARIGLDALSIVKHLRPEVQIYLYGSREKGRASPEYAHLGLLRVEACNALYNRCAVGLSLSASNPSRVPFEMMAAGLPVVELWREPTLYDFPQEAVLLAQPRPEALAEAILQLLEDEALRTRMGTAGTRFMQRRGADTEVRQFVGAVERVLAGGEPDFEATDAPMYQAPAVGAGDRVGSLPLSLLSRINAPPNAFINSLSPLLRGLVGIGGRLARRLLESR